jgi:hypothetical protein
LIFWDASGLGVAENAWQRAVSKWPMECDGSVGIQLSQEELTLLLGGIDLTQTKARNWYRKTLPEYKKTIRGVPEQFLD